MAVETKLKERDYQIKILKEDKQMYMDQVLSLRKQGHMTTELEVLYCLRISALNWHYALFNYTLCRKRRRPKNQ